MLQLLTNPKFAIFLVILIVGASIGGVFSDWLANTLSGPEYCFTDVETVSLALQTANSKYSITHSSGDSLCFRTTDSSLVERINDQIQDRKLQVELAKIKANQEFWDKYFFFIIIAIAVILIIVLIIINESGYRY